jgi:hypothetical protein
VWAGLVFTSADKGAIWLREIEGGDRRDLIQCLRRPVSRRITEKKTVQYHEGDTGGQFVVLRR